MGLLVVEESLSSIGFLMEASIGDVVVSGGLAEWLKAVAWNVTESRKGLHPFKSDILL